MKVTTKKGPSDKLDHVVEVNKMVEVLSEIGTVAKSSGSTIMEMNSSLGQIIGIVDEEIDKKGPSDG